MYKSYVVFLFRFFIYLTTLRKLILPNLQNSKIPINYIITAPLISIKKKKSIFVSISPRNKIIKNSNDKSSFIESSNHGTEFAQWQLESDEIERERIVSLLCIARGWTEAGASARATIWCSRRRVRWNPGIPEAQPSLTERRPWGLKTSFCP